MRNKEQRTIYSKEYYKTHADEYNERAKQWFLKNKERNRENQRRRYAKNKEKLMKNRFCLELEKIENYDKAKKDNFKNWILHHRLELNENGTFAHNSKELIEMNLYYHRPPSELIFLTKEEHDKLPTKKNGRH